VPAERVTFEGSRGARLAARIETPADEAPRAWALFAHCFTCSKDARAAVHLSRALAGRGFGVLRFDFTGLGESEGEFADTDFSSDVDDLVAAARYLAEAQEAPSVLVGHSLGGAAVLKAAARIPEARAVATLGAPAEASHVLKHVKDSLEEIEARGEATVTLGGRPFPISRAFVRDLRETSMQKAIAALRRPLLLFHSPVDAVVGIENAARIFGWARHPKSFVALDGADHLLLEERDAHFAGEVLAAWAGRYVARDRSLAGSFPE